MNDIFRLKIVSKRQVTLPQILMLKLNLAEGDELEIEVSGDQIVAVRPMKVVPTQLFTREMLLKLKERAEKMASGIVAKDPTSRLPNVRESSLAQVGEEKSGVGEEKARAEGHATTNAY